MKPATSRRLVAGRVVATPVNVGDFVKQGQVDLRARSPRRPAAPRPGARRSSSRPPPACARRNRASASTARATFDPATVAGSGRRARHLSNPPRRRPAMAAADAKRYENLVATGDVSRSAFEKARTQQETAEAQANAARQQYEAALNAARQSYGRRGELPGLARRRPRAARPGRKGACRHHHPRALRWLHHRAPRGRRRIRRAHQQDRHHRPHRHHEAPAADAGAAGRPRENRHDRDGARRRLSRIAISPARSPPSIPRSIPTRASSSWKPGSTIPKANCGPACSPRRASSCPAARPPSSCRAAPSSATRPPIPSRSSPSTTTRRTCAWSSSATPRATRSASSTDSPATRPSPPAHQSELFDGAPVQVR